MLYYSRNKASIPPGLEGPSSQVNICNGLSIPVKNFFDRRWVPTLQGKKHGGTGDGYRWTRRKGILVLSWVTLILLPTSEWLWAILCPTIFISYHHFLYLLFALTFLFLSWFLYLTLPQSSPFLIFFSCHPSSCPEGFARWERRRLGWMEIF